MKHWVYAVLVLLLFSPFSFSQMYRVQDYSERTEMPAGKAALRWEISAAAFANTLALQDFTGQAVSDGEIGADLRLLYKASDWFAVGAEGKVSTAYGTQNGLSGYLGRSVGAVAKVTLTPDSMPRAYVLAGGGKSSYDVEFFSEAKRTLSSYYAWLGWGVETDLSERVFGAFEVHGIYSSAKDDLYFSLKRRWSAEVLLRLDMRF